MKKGFTLIELLAVIVILAIIALIATPIVLSIIEETKESAVLRSAEHYLSSVEQSIAKKSLAIGGSFSPTTCVVQSDGNLLCDGKDELVVELNGEEPKSGTITFNNGKITYVTLTLSNKTITKDENGKLVLGEALEEDEKVLAPGLYDENDNLIASWADLTSMEYQTVTYYEYVWDDVTGEELEVERKSAILTVNENGVLTTNYKDWLVENLSAEYLVGKLVIDASVTSIGDYAFMYCEGLTSVIIHDSLTNIGELAFSVCTSLESIIIPDSVTHIGNWAFANCTSLESFTMPNNITEFYSNWLEDSGVTSLTLGEGITAMVTDMFDGCRGLTSITIPSSVTSIGGYAFYGCENLTTINYRGTEEEWNAIVKEEYWDEEIPSNTVINYNYKG